MLCNNFNMARGSNLSYLIWTWLPHHVSRRLQLGRLTGGVRVLRDAPGPCIYFLLGFPVSFFLLLGSHLGVPWSLTHLEKWSTNKHGNQQNIPFHFIFYSKNRPFKTDLFWTSSLFAACDSLSASTALQFIALTASAESEAWPRWWRTGTCDDLGDLTIQAAAWHKSACEQNWGKKGDMFCFFGIFFLCVVC